MNKQVSQQLAIAATTFWVTWQATNYSMESRAILSSVGAALLGFAKPFTGSDKPTETETETN